MAGKPRGKPFKPGEGGRPAGVPNKATREIKEAARKLLEDPDYLRNLRTRLMRGTAGPVEVLLFKYAYGNPPETVDIGTKDGQPLAMRVVFGGRYKPEHE